MALSMKLVSQVDGTDLDSNNVKLSMTLQARRPTPGDPRSIALDDAVLNIVCTKCGTRGTGPGPSLGWRTCRGELTGGTSVCVWVCVCLGRSPWLAGHFASDCRVTGGTKYDLIPEEDLDGLGSGPAGPRKGPPGMRVIPSIEYAPCPCLSTRLRVCEADQ